MARRVVISLFLCLASGALAPAPARAECAETLCWRLENRFRLFRDPADFARHEAAFVRARGEARPGEGLIAASERILQAGAGREGWAARMVDALCFNEASNRPFVSCARDGIEENYLRPVDLAVSLVVRPPAGFETAACDWTFGGRTIGRTACLSPPRLLRARVEADTIAEVTLRRPDGATSGPHRAVVRPTQILVVGLGDSFASGEGNPDKPMRFRDAREDGRVVDSGQCFLRIRTSFPGGFLPPVHLPARDLDPNLFPRDCPPSPREDDASLDEFAAGRARWLYAPCHRSLYGQQMRAALALALDDEHRAVAFMPLACTGARTATLLTDYHPAREKRLRPWTPRSGKAHMLSGSEAQLRHLTRLLSGRKPDLVMLSVGGNDIGFAGLVADFIIRRDGPEAALRRFVAVTPEQATTLLAGLPRALAKTRTRLAPLVGGDWSRVLVTAYPNPLRRADGTLCAGMARGFDLHPGFAVADAAAAGKVNGVIAALETTMRRSAAGMTFVDAHLEAFAGHSVCEAPASDPPFDRACLRDGGSANPDAADALSRPLACAMPANAFRPYAPRGRWWRTPNDSFLAAATYADDLPWIARHAKPHDALWGVIAMTYGGALHPTAEGHAAIADAAFAAAKARLDRRP